MLSIELPHMDYLKSKKPIKRPSSKRRLEQQTYHELIDLDNKVRNLKRLRSFREKVRI